MLCYTGCKKKAHQYISLSSVKLIYFSVKCIKYKYYLSIDLLPRYPEELQQWRMCLGKHNLTHKEPSEHCFKLSGIYRHEGFKYPPGPTVQFDIALVKLDGEVIPSDEISYACLPSMEEKLPGGKMCYAIGWGAEAGTVHTVHTSLDLYSKLWSYLIIHYCLFYYPNTSLLDNCYILSCPLLDLM